MKIVIGWVEWTFAALLLAYTFLSFVPGAAPFQFLLKVASAVFGGWVFARFARRVVQNLLWRLRNRLIVAYVFIALVPVVLISILVGVGASFLGGQLTIYLVTSELERRTAALRGTIEFLAHNTTGEQTGWAENAVPILERENPGIQLRIQDGTTWVYPADSD
ncbi:MAG: hypothetical protein H7039_24955, partial [Bryobacteraceae bacterium]|nr:hypothetical protein [Bryobacteraceae bacterium]